MKVELTESAFSDLNQMLEYYREQGAPENGSRIIAEILNKSERLIKHPDSGRVVPEFGIPFLREIISPPFRIVYRRDHNKIWIIRVWRSERQLKLE